MSKLLPGEVIWECKSCTVRGLVPADGNHVPGWTFGAWGDWFCPTCAKIVGIVDGDEEYQDALEARTAVLVEILTDPDVASALSAQYPESFAEWCEAAGIDPREYSRPVKWESK